MLVIIICTGIIRICFEFASYTTSERNGSVEICVLTYELPRAGTPRPFVASVFTQDGTAGKQYL